MAVSAGSFSGRRNVPGRLPPRSMPFSRNRLPWPVTSPVERENTPYWPFASIRQSLTCAVEAALRPRPRLLPEMVEPEIVAWAEFCVLMPSQRLAEMVEPAMVASASPLSSMPCQLESTLVSVR